MPLICVVEISQAIKIEENRFGFEPEITAKFPGPSAELMKRARKLIGKTVSARFTA